MLIKNRTSYKGKIKLLFEKYPVEPFFNKTWSDDFKQISLVPTIFITRSYGGKYNLAINFLCFDFGLWITRK
jgi:hypothetical protein